MSTALATTPNGERAVAALSPEHAPRRHTGWDPHSRRWPLQPLLDLTGQRAHAVAVLAGYSCRSGFRWAAAGFLSDYTADRVAVALGLHPVLVWPDWFNGALEEDPP